MADRIKLGAAALILGGAVVAFYALSDQSTLLRALGLLLALLIAGAIAAQTEKGRRAWTFFGEARTEARKVVWPNRQETVQTTLIVLVMVALVGVLLWLLDMGLVWAVRLFTGA